MCDKAVLDCLWIVPDWHKTHEMCDKTADDYSIALEFVPDWCESKEMCDKTISENSFMLNIILINM